MKYPFHDTETSAAKRKKMGGKKRTMKYCSKRPKYSMPCKWVLVYFSLGISLFCPIKAELILIFNVLEDVRKSILQKSSFRHFGESLTCLFWSNREASGIFSSLRLCPSWEEAKSSLGIATGLPPLSETESLPCFCLPSDTISVVS